jgi:SAM-dependent methyltransferase
MKITTTRNGLRLSEHGVVISELRTSEGPTHSVFDVLAALIAVLKPAGLVGVLGFAGGGMMAPLRGLGVTSVLHSVDLDPQGYELFRRHCPQWSAGVRWTQADALVWLNEQPQKFDLLMDDLSVSDGEDVVKPDLSWTALPKLMRRQLKPGGIAVFNLLSPPGGAWNRALPPLIKPFAQTHVITLDEFENHILVAGQTLPTARELGGAVRRVLRQLCSRQAARLRIRQTAAGR